MTPFESWYGTKPNVSHLRTFGSEFYVLIPAEMRRKLDAKGLLCIFIGNSESQKGDRYWDPSTGKVNVSRDVTPLDHHYTDRLSLPDNQNGVDVFSSNPVGTPPAVLIPLEDISGDPLPLMHDASDDSSDQASLPQEAPLPPQQPAPSTPPLRRTNSKILPDAEPRRSARIQGRGKEAIEPLPDTEPRRSARIQAREKETVEALTTSTSTHSREPKQQAFAAALAHATHQIEPDQFRDVEFSDDAPRWMVAMQKEYDSLLQNDTWDLVPLPPDRSLIKARWTYKIKPGYKDTDETIYKARFVAKGFSQQPGVDYNEHETYAPVLKHDSLRVLFSIASVLDLELYQFDVKTAFLHGDLDEELYVEQPEGFVQPGRERFVCRLKKPLYGLKQSSRKWNEKFNSFLIQFGLTRSTADPCIYFHRGEDVDDVTILGIWVDDILVATRTVEKARAIVEYLETHFEMTSRVADYFIGLEIIRDRTRQQIFVSQSKFIVTLLQRFRMSECNPSSVPADPDSRLSVTNCPLNVDALNSTPYRAAIGALMYAAKMTRPDILFALIAASRYCQNPGKAHWAAVKRILSYLSGTVNYGICYGGTSRDMRLEGYSDSDLGGCPDTRRSTSGLLFTLNGGPVAWTSHLQKPIAQSTSEAEYYAAGHASREIVWLRELLKQLGFEQLGPTPLMCDNKSTILMILNPVFHERTKHIGLKYHFIRQQLKSRTIEMVSVPTDDQLGDILTKPLAAGKFNLNRSRIGVLPVPIV